MGRLLARGIMTTMLALLVVGTAHAQVHIDIGIRLPAPPQLVVVPEVRTVQYVPTVSANLFFYGGQYWAYANGGWHVSRAYNGPWIVVGPQFVPRPVLLVPVSYYRVPPGHWKQWARNHPPHWGNEWGHDWAEKRSWKDRDDDQGERPGKGYGKGQGKGHGKGHGG